MNSFMIVCSLSWILLLHSLVSSQEIGRSECPFGWVSYDLSCYKFIRSTPMNHLQAMRSCQNYNTQLVSVNTMDEHSFILEWLKANDPQHKTWYTSGVDTATNLWRWQGDNTFVSNLDQAFIPGQELEVDKKVIAYNYTVYGARWGFLKVYGTEEFPFICEINKELLHMIIINERGLDYGVIIKDKEKLPYAPKIIQEPVTVVFDTASRQENDEISLKCVADGYPHPSYEWYKEEYENDQLRLILVDPKNDKRITITDGSLTISKPDQTRDRGRYHCRAFNRFGRVVSQSAQLSFGYINQFNLKRSTEQGKQNWGKAIYCDPPQHYPEVHYYWSRDYFPNLVDEDKRTFVSQDGNLYFSALENIDIGNYQCTVQSVISATGRQGPDFHLDVIAHPSSQQLQFPNNFPKVFPEAPVAGQDVRLECVAFGYPVPSFNWTKVGEFNSLPPQAIFISYNRVLILPKVSIEDIGEYECRAHNGRNSISKSVTLIIQAVPMFTIPLQDMHMDTNSNLYWMCEAFGIPEVQYEWLKNGELLTPSYILRDNRIKIQHNVLTIRALDASRDEGLYQCRASNQMGVTYSTGQLRVLSLKPSFIKYPMERETYAVDGGNITILCRPEGAPMPTFIWRKDGQALTSDPRRMILQNGYLIIKPVRQEDNGVYTCTAENVLGRDQTEGRLVVLRKPQLVNPPRPFNSVRQNDTLHLQCFAVTEHGLDLAYAWYQNGLRVLPDKYGHYSLAGYPGALDVHNMSFAETGNFECVVKTPISQVSGIANVIVEGPPGPPGGVQIFALKGADIRLTWSDGAINGQGILTYKIEGRTHWNQTWVTVVDYVRAIPSQYSRKETVVQGHLLSPWCQYVFRVAARNIYGLGEPSSPSPMHNTDPAPPSTFPANIGGGGGKVGDLTITWDPLPSQEQNGPNIWYKVFYKPAGSDRDPQEKELRDLGNANMFVARVNVKNFYSPYKVQVQANNALGAGPISREVDVYSAEDLPQVVPVQVGVRAYNSTALNVTWLLLDTSHESIRGKLIGFRVRYWLMNRIDTSLYSLSRSTNNQALIVGLQPYTYYSVTVSAYNGAGAGPESEFFNEHTYKAAPLKPPNSVEVTPLSPTTVKVTWRFSSPTVDEEALQGFKVRYWEADLDFSHYQDVYVPLGQQQLEAHVTGLVPGKIYKLRVLGYSLGGDGRMSSPVWEFKMGGASPGHNIASYANRIQANPLCLHYPLMLLLCMLVYRCL